MNSFVFIFFMVLFSAVIIAQAPDTLWTRTFGTSDIDEGNSVQQTIDGGYIITGLKKGSGGFFDYEEGDLWLIKTDAIGDTLWTKTYEFGSKDWGNSIQQTTDSGYIITGVNNYNGPMYGPWGDLWLIKTDANGDTLWTKSFGGNGSEVGRSAQQTTDGGYIITGYTHPYGLGSVDLWLIKTNANGDSIWTKTFGDSGSDVGNSVDTTFDGGYIITGTTETFGGGVDDVWLIKTDANGDTLWTRTFDGSPYDRGNSVQQTSDGGYIITGMTSAYRGVFFSGDVWLIKTDANGDAVWTKTFGDTSRAIRDWGNSVQQTNDCGYIVTGVRNFDHSGSSGVWLIKTDTNGDTLWTKTVGGSYPDEGNSVQQTSDGGYIVTGTTDSFGSEDVWLIKLAPDATTIEEKPTAAFADGFHLKQNYPNPFNPVTVINYRLSKKSNVQVIIYDINGRKIKTFVKQLQNAGEHSISFDATGLASGIYIYNLKTDMFEQSRKMLLLR